MAGEKDFDYLAKKKGLKLVHLNVRSLAGKIDQLRVSLPDSKIEIITFSETWLTSAYPAGQCDLLGYTTFRQDRTLNSTSKKRGGGLITYITNELADSTTDLSKLSSCSVNIEAQWLKIVRDNSKNIVLCNIYRPPDGNLDKAITYMNQCLKVLNMVKTDIFIMGDWNANYKNKQTPSYKKLLFFENSNSLKQIVQDTTRNTDKTKTLIDLILTNADHITESGTLSTYVSDHQPIYVIKKKERTKHNSVTFEGRSYRQLNLDEMLNNLGKTNWDDLFTCSTPGDAWDILQTRVATELDKQCPVRTTKVKNYVPDWISPNLIDLVKDRDYFYNKAKKTQSEDDWNIAKHLRNVTNSGIRKAKADFVVNELQRNAKDGAKFWRELKKIYPSKKTHQSRTKIQLTDCSTGNRVEDSDTAMFINDFFVNVGNFAIPHTAPKKRGKKSKKTAKRNGSVLTQQTQPPWSLANFEEEEVLKVLKDIEVGKSSGLQHISNKVLKSVLKVLVTQITYILNLSVDTCIFPKAWKDALVIPIPKGGDLSNVSNYRPISLLPQPGKVLEKLVHNKLTDYIESNLLLNSNQHGFRKHRSTLDALHQLTGQINCNMDSKYPTLATFIDFKKAFDCVQHDLLIDKLQNLHLDARTVSWLKNYLMNRQQRVLANNIVSDSLPITQGVPQGSIIGPLLYIIYANDIASIIKHSQVAFYADDTVIYSKCKSLKKAQKLLRLDLKALERWCDRNGIFINAQKTKYMVFGSKVRLAKPDVNNIKLSIRNHDLSRVHSYYYLGITLDEQLNYEIHAQNTLRKVKSKLIQLRTMRYFLSKQAALLVYKNMILPILEYGDIFFSALPINTRKKMQIMQNKALRIVFNKNSRESRKVLHHEAALSELKVRRKLHTLQFLYRKRLDKKLLVRRAYNKRITRSSKKLLFKLKKPNTEKFKDSLFYTGYKIWNQLPVSIQLSDDPNVFKYKIKTLFIPKDKPNKLN